MNKFKRKITTKNKCSALLLSDWHIRETTPQCRQDNFWEAQEKKINFILDLAKKHNCPILCAGDLGHYPRWSCKLLEWTINKFKGYKIFVIAGQHDIPHHQILQWPQSGIGVLHAAGAIEFIQSPKIINNEFMVYPFSYGEKIINPKEDNNDLPKIAMIHEMIVEKKDLFPNQNAPKGHQLLKQFPEFSIILTGDNHNPFVAERAGRLLVNPGSMMRTTAAQINHLPRVYLWYAKENKVEKVYLPIEHDVISREHIETTGQRSKRMDAYLERMKQDVEIQLSYPQNMEAYFAKHRTQIAVKNKVWEAIE